MTQFIIQGGVPLKGAVKVSGAKNAALKMIAASILATKPVILRNVPRISDVDIMISLVNDFGVIARWQDNHTLILDPSNIKPANPNPKLVKKLRASVALIGPALARFGKISLPTPGGDHIGHRPIDTHLNALKQLGATIKKNGELLTIKTDGLKGTSIFLDEMSVTATENTLLAAVTTRGTTKIHVAASEPEIVNLANLLTTMGARIQNAGSTVITVQGVKNLSGGAIGVIADRIEASTLLLAGMITQGKVTIKNINTTYLANFIPTLKGMGASITQENSSVTILPAHTLKPITIDTRPYPGFSTDLQSPLAAVMTQAKGTSTIFETLFEDRFNYVDELNSMGAKIRVIDRHNIKITGPVRLKAANLETRDIRAGAALVLAALNAHGKSTITHAELIDRGYERLDEKLAKLGAKIKRIES